MCHFHLQQSLHRSSLKCGMLTLLPLLESRALACSLSTFNLAWKTAILLALVTTKCCCDLPFNVLAIGTFFCSVMLLYLFQFLAVKWIDWVIHHLKFALCHILMLICGLCFTSVLSGPFVLWVRIGSTCLSV